jgi:hypothetical protein
MILLEHGYVIHGTHGYVIHGTHGYVKHGTHGYVIHGTESRGNEVKDKTIHTSFLHFQNKILVYDIQMLVFLL